jgi:hypothetical protein
VKGVLRIGGLEIPVVLGHSVNSTPMYATGPGIVDEIIDMEIYAQGRTGFPDDIRKLLALFAAEDTEFEIAAKEGKGTKARGFVAPNNKGQWCFFASRTADGIPLGEVDGWLGDEPLAQAIGDAVEWTVPRWMRK